MAKYDPADKFNQPMSVVVLVGMSPTDAEIAEARGRIAAGESSMDVWAEIDARIEARMEARRVSQALESMREGETDE